MELFTFGALISGRLFPIAQSSITLKEVRKKIPRTFSDDKKKNIKLTSNNQKIK